MTELRQVLTSDIAFLVLSLVISMSVISTKSNTVLPCTETDCIARRVLLKKLRQVLTTDIAFLASPLQLPQSRSSGSNTVSPCTELIAPSVAEKIEREAKPLGV